MAADKTSINPQLRLRVFAGPNGSGKSTVIKEVRKTKSGGKPIDFGYYINADDIAASLRGDGFSFYPFNTVVTSKDFQKIAFKSGLVNIEFNHKKFISSFLIRENVIRLKDLAEDERMAQIIADFLRKRLLMERKRFSFETVFSHSSKLDIMSEAVIAGYKVYLYFVATEGPEINIQRVDARKKLGGHGVPKEKIISRYYKSLELMYGAAQMAYQCYWFDNSSEELQMFAHFKMAGPYKKWDFADMKKIPNWFFTYYLDKMKPAKS